MRKTKGARPRRPREGDRDRDQIEARARTGSEAAAAGGERQMNKKFASGGKRPMLGKGRFGRTKPRSRGLSSGCSPGPTGTGESERGQTIVRRRVHRC